MIENAELIMQMLEMYQMYKQQVPAELDEYLRYVAETGNTLFQWTLVKPFIREKILNVIAEFAEQSALADIPPYPNVDPFNYEAMKNMLLERFDTFNGPPFTIQRLCELLACPRKEYNRVDKFMRAVEKNILVVSTCELRSKREESIVNGVPGRWENVKDSDISIDMVDKSNVISDANVLNGSETVESLLNELESMKTPETKLDEIQTEHKDHLVVHVTDEVESHIIVEEPKQDNQILINDTPQTQNMDSTEIVQQVITDIPTVTHESICDPTEEQNSVICEEIQPAEVKEQISENPVDDLKNLSNDINLENVVEAKPEESIIDSNKLDQPEIITIDADRVEGSVIHQTPDSDNKVEVDFNVLQQEVLLEKSNEGDESMDVQVEDITKGMELEVNCDNVKELECLETTATENDKQVDESAVAEVPAVNVPAVDVPAVDVPAVDVPSVDIPAVVDIVPTEMDVEPEVESEKNEIDDTQQETVSVNEEETKTAEPSTIIEEPQRQDENKLTESE